MGSQRFRHEWATELTLDVGDSFWWFWHPSSFVSWPFWPLESLPDMFETLPDELQSLLRYMRIFWHSEDYYSLVWDFSWHIWDFSVWDAFWLFDTVLTFFFFFFLAVPCCLWALSSPTRDWTWARSVRARSPNYWTTRGMPLPDYFLILNCLRHSPMYLKPILTSLRLFPSIYHISSYVWHHSWSIWDSSCLWDPSWWM